MFREGPRRARAGLGDLGRARFSQAGARRSPPRCFPPGNPQPSAGGVLVQVTPRKHPPRSTGTRPARNHRPSERREQRGATRPPRAAVGGPGAPRALRQGVEDFAGHTAPREACHRDGREVAKQLQRRSNALARGRQHRSTRLAAPGVLPKLTCLRTWGLPCGSVSLRPSEASHLLGVEK